MARSAAVVSLLVAGGIFFLAGLPVAETGDLARTPNPSLARAATTVKEPPLRLRLTKVQAHNRLPGKKQSIPEVCRRKCTPRDFFECCKE